MHTNLLATCLYLCLFEKPKREYFPYSIECPTSIWLLLSAMTPFRQRPSLVWTVCHFSPDKARQQASPRHFLPKERDAWGTHSGPLQIRPTRMEQSNRDKMRRIAQPRRLHHRAGTHAPVPLQGAACARGYPWVSSAARPTPPRAARVPRQLLYLLNLATAGY